MEILIFFNQIFLVIRDIFELSGVIIISFGGLYAIYIFFMDTIFKRLNSDLRFKRFRITLGRTIILGLEVIIAGDVISTTLDQTYSRLGIVILLVIIRTLINYFLSKDLWPDENCKTI